MGILGNVILNASPMKRFGVSCIPRRFSIDLKRLTIQKNIACKRYKCSFQPRQLLRILQPRETRKPMAREWYRRFFHMSSQIYLIVYGRFGVCSRLREHHPTYRLIYILTEKKLKLRIYGGPGGNPFRRTNLPSLVLRLNVADVLLDDYGWPHAKLDFRVPINTRSRDLLSRKHHSTNFDLNSPFARFDRLGN
ncbi:hypothetical protein J6590_022452 [Homalodisca vitripennis]|nr:hypothetical protein J6590_022452 [Homalodisca vitripennis]